MHPTGANPKESVKIRLISKADWDRGFRPEDKDEIKIPDKRFPDAPRTDELLHCDGPSKDKNNPSYVGHDGDGSEGCGAYEHCAETQRELLQAFKNGDRGFTVKYFTTKEERDKAIAEQVRKNQQKQQGNGPSKTRKKSELIKGEKSVVVGEDQRAVGHKDALITNGKVVEHSQTVFVGPKQLQASGVGDMTTDGSPINTGERSVLLV
jgi:hypothetical protein